MTSIATPLALVDRTKAQNSRLHQLLSALGIDSDGKAELVLTYTQGRTGRSSEMLAWECENLNNALQQMVNDQLQPMRRKALSLAHQLGWEHADGRVNMARVDGFCRSRSASKRPLNRMNKDDLRKLVTQLEQMVARSPRNG